MHPDYISIVEMAVTICFMLVSTGGPSPLELRPPKCHKSAKRRMTAESHYEGPRRAQPAEWKAANMKSAF